MTLSRMYSRGHGHRQCHEFDDISDVFACARISLLIELFVVSPSFQRILILIIFDPTFGQNGCSVHLDPKLSVRLLILPLLPAEMYFLSCKLINFCAV